MPDEVTSLVTVILKCSGAGQPRSRGIAFGRTNRWRWTVALAIGAAFLVVPAHAVETVTLAPRQFAPTSPAAPSQRFFSDARRLAATTTIAWKGTDTDLSASGPALIFPLLDRNVSEDAVIIEDCVSNRATCKTPKTGARFVDEHSWRTGA